MKKKLSIFFLSCLSLVAARSHADIPAVEHERRYTLSSILEIIDEQHPNLRSADAGVGVALGAELRAQGGFDPVFRGQAKQKWEDLYPNSTFEAGITQRIPRTGSQLGFFYRRGQGKFGPYELDRYTLSGGEVGARLSQPLLKDLFLDSSRFQLLSAQQDHLISLQRREQVKIDSRADATRAYLTWLSHLEKQRIREEILELAVIRQKTLQKRVQSGDVPKMQYLDNERLILDRRSKWIESKQLTFIASRTLAVHTGLGAEKIGAAEGLDTLTRSVATWTPDMGAAPARPELVQNELEIGRTELDRRVAMNALLPELNLIGEVSRDQGEGPNAYRATQYLVGLGVSVPLLFSEGRGRKVEVEQKRIQLEARRDWVTRNMRRDLETTVTRILTAQEVLDLRIHLLALAKDIGQAERKRFAAGAADLIEVNIREEATATAASELVDARLALGLAAVDYWSTTGNTQFETLFSRPDVPPPGT